MNDSDEHGVPPEPTASEEERWLVIKGRRWRRTDPCLPSDFVEQLTSELGRGRSGVRTAKAAGDENALARARQRVNLAKHGLGERGPYWWDEPVAGRIARAGLALDDLSALDD